MVPFRIASAILVLLAAGLTNAFAQNDDVDCSQARDPERCTIHQAALAACADQRGRAKTACLNEKIPPPDCSKAENPARCEAIQRAKQNCAGKIGKPLKACMSGERQKTAKKKPIKKAVAKKPAAAPAPARRTP